MITKKLALTVIVSLVLGTPSLVLAAKVFQKDTGGTLTNGLKAYYKLEDATDFYSTNELSNSGGIVFDAGKVNNAADCDQNCSSVNLDNMRFIGTMGIATTSPISFSLWINPFDATSSANFSALMAYEDNIGNFYYELGYTPSTHTLLFSRNNSASSISTSTILASSTWHHVVLTYDSVTLKGYLDNINFANTAATGTVAVPDPVVFYDMFANTNNGGLYGKIDETGVWNRALTVTEINDLWNAGAGQTMISSTTPVTATTCRIKAIGRCH